jgi:hypothetical protein
MYKDHWSILGRYVGNNGKFKVPVSIVFKEVKNTASS